MYEQFIKQVYHNQELVTEHLIDRYYDLFSREGNPEAFLSLVNGHFRDHTRRLRHIAVPTLVIWGEEDSWIPVEYAYRFHKRISQSELAVYERVGHIPMEEAPVLTSQELLGFLASC